MMKGYRTRYTYRKKYLDENFDLEGFDPSKSYSAAELEAYTDIMLREDAAKRPSKKGFPQILFQDHAESRWTREVHNAAGVPDDEITHAQSKDGQTMFWRQHPEGRKVNSEAQRKTNGAGYFR